MDKPLFLPLNAEYFDAFMDGSKDTEYRLNGPRWNAKTCIPERQILLSRGYGRQNRALGVIANAPIYQLIELSLPLQKSLRALFELPRWANPEIIAIKIKEINRIFYSVDAGAPEGDFSVRVTHERQEDGSFKIVNWQKL